MMLNIFRLLFITLLSVVSFGFSGKPNKPAPAGKPKLVVFISIDQMRADFLNRFAKEFTGGLKKLSREGVLFTNADLNFASSETGPGHATLSTGAYPGTNGILANEWIDPRSRKQVYCVEDQEAKPVEGEGGGFSPKNLVVTSIGDWLKAASPRSKVISASAKDRAAVLMGGQRPDYAFWYDRKTGRMVTSDYYTKTIPEWAKSFNAGGWIEKNVPDAWTKLMPDSVYAVSGPDEMEGEMKWDGNSAFPHRFKPENKKEMFLTSPYGDMMIFDFAKRAVLAEQLGQRDVTDLLSVSLSCTDYVGHSFGPDSHEMHDQLLRIDRAMGDFFIDLERMVGKENLLVVLSADHAVLPLPEYLTQIKHESARRILMDREIKPRVAELDRTLQKELGVGETLIQSSAFLNYAAAARGGVDSVTLEKKVRSGLLKIDGVADIYFRRELMNRTTPARPYLAQFQNSYFPSRGEDFQIRFCEHCLITTRPTGTTHGSVYRYDTHVPIVFWSAGMKSARVSRTVRTVDIAPTLAKLLGLKVPSSVNGKPLKEISH